MKKVVLFKSTSEDYKKAFSGSNYEPIFVEPLQFVFINLQGLSEKLIKNDYDGIILSSPRAIEAVSKCWSPSKYVVWNSKRVYTVGEVSCQKIKHMLGLDALGGTTGNAENLAKLIASENPESTRFLFPCGNLRSEILPNELEAAKMIVEPLAVYETKENEHLRQRLIDLNENINTCCMVFFSPSGCEYIYRQLQTFSNNLSLLPHFAIGNSTAHKIENLGVEIAGVAAKPKPECVLESVVEYFRTFEACGYQHLDLR
ncbi:uroporphyrinogen-III synthase-like [Pieris brassicae]|uniref:uroporphyrinogen-III synthase-like n=1 Tax=Pieris brassicae TaxID=7116 RepID=UPI001E65F79A|nr:uroporphyrinogen-III synthase-like [Pieris brassicae]